MKKRNINRSERMEWQTTNNTTILLKKRNKTFYLGFHLLVLFFEELVFFFDLLHFFLKLVDELRESQHEAFIVNVRAQR